MNKGFYKIFSRNFVSGKPNFIKNFNLSRKELRALNNQMKEEWVKPGWDKIVGVWLLTCAGLTLGMIVVGGYVRLNKAGLSMVKWDLTRIYTPKTVEEWEKEFKEYKSHPQYKNDFPNLTMQGFKFIYLLEHYHRQLGKVLGLFIILPTLLFSFTKILRKKLMKKTALICGVVILQGTIGMWMVKSGLNENLGENYKKNNVRVAPYRLATHFTFGIMTYWLLLNSALFLLQKPRVLVFDPMFWNSNNVIRRNLLFSLHLILFTAIYGSLLAGHDAGKISNTFPKMGDIWYPTKLHYYQNMTWFRNNIDNQFLVHFNHRFLATVTLATVFFQIFRVSGLQFIHKRALRSFVLFVLFISIQYSLGVYSVLKSVPPKFAHLHQFWGVMAFTACLIGINTTRKVRSRDIQILFKKLYEKNNNQFEKYLFHYKNLYPESYNKSLSKEVEQIKEMKNL